MITTLVFTEVPEMQEFIKRMIIERDDLKGKISRAKKAVENPPFGSDAKSIELLKAKIEPMEKYLTILENRINYESR
jgi:hypothetical protein